MYMHLQLGQILDFSGEGDHKSHICVHIEELLPKDAQLYGTFVHAGLQIGRH